MSDEFDVDVFMPDENENTDDENTRYKLAVEFTSVIKNPSHSTTYLTREELEALLLLITLSKMNRTIEEGTDFKLSDIAELYEKLALSKEGKGLEAVKEIYKSTISAENEIPELSSEMTPFQLLLQKLRGG